MENVFVELSIIILIAIAFAGFMRLLRQPLMIGYILTGIAVSPYFLNIMGPTENFQTFAQIGIAFLLFMVGLSLNPRVIKEVGKVAIITGIGQIVFTSLVGFVFAVLLKFDLVTSLYLSIALTNSSTIIIIKLLSDRGDLEKLYARIAIGFLIVQDILAIFILMFISAGSMEPLVVFNTLMKGVGVLFLLFVVGMYVLPKVLNRVARSQEFLLLFSIGWCLLLATILYALDFSVEIGALVAGVTLSLSPYRFEISSRMKPLRDFFIVLFFILLGTQMTFFDVQKEIGAIIAFSLFIIIGNPLIMMIIMGILGYTKRTSFYVGLVVAQISEFSFIMVALGVKVGHVQQEVLSIVTAVGLVTIAVSTYMIMYADQLYRFCEPWLGIFERKGKKQETKEKKPVIYDILLFGYNKMGYDFLASFRKLKKKYLVIDYDPDVVARLTKEGHACIYGDASDAELLDDLHVEKTKLVISTIPDPEISAGIVRKIREKNKKNIIIMVAHHIDAAMELYKAGATYVVIPQLVGGSHASALLKKHGLNLTNFFKEGMLHLKELRNRVKKKNVKKVREMYAKYLRLAGKI